MRRSIRAGSHSAAACLVAFAAVVGCTSTEPDTSSDPIPGRYVIVLSRSSAVCAPRNLPAPTLSDTTQYAPMPAAAISTQLSAEVRRTDSVVSLAGTTSTGASPSTLLLNGSISSNDVAHLSSISTRAEGPRVGGHSFFVTQANADTAWFITLVLDPPGATEVDLRGSGAEEFTFRDGDPAGSIYTTCVVTDSISGRRLAGS